MKQIVNTKLYLSDWASDVPRVVRRVDEVATVDADEGAAGVDRVWSIPPRMEETHMEMGGRHEV